MPSGYVFLGAAAEVTADGLEPEAFRGGGFLDLQPGTCNLNTLKVDNIINCPSRLMAERQEIHVARRYYYNE
jgi:hypothetical protein